MIEEVNRPWCDVRGRQDRQPAFDRNTATFSFEGTGKASDYKAIVTVSPGESLTVEDHRVASGPAGITGCIVGAPRLLQGCCSRSLMPFCRNTRSSSKGREPRRAFRGRQRLRRDVCAIQAIFPFDGRGKDSVANDYQAIVTISPSESITLQGDQVVSGPAGVTGYIARSPDGSFRVVVSGRNGVRPRNPRSWSKRSTTPALTFAEGNAVDQFVDPNQVVYSFQGAGKAHDYRATVTISPGEILTVDGGQVVSGPAGITGYIVTAPMAPSRWLFAIPWPG